MYESGGLEITEYGTDHEIPGKVQGAISEIVRDQGQTSPSVNMRVTFVGNLMKLTFHAYEMHLPVRMKEVEHAAKSGLDETLKNIKKQIKAKIGHVPTFKEKKDMANTSANKVSLNERYMYSSWRFYELG